MEKCKISGFVKVAIIYMCMIAVGCPSDYPPRQPGGMNGPDRQQAHLAL